ncbi:hypothetical protein HK097_004000, partial [Rhizophlyctis rosea]
DGSVRDGFGYYETIAGGAGAGPTWDGRSGVHTHMTNTRITDPEILERRYPVLLRKFGLREGSGGQGLHRGGDGCIRELEFLDVITVSLLTERRVFSPYGLEGGEDGKAGRNILIKKNGDTERLLSFGAKNTTVVRPGDRIRIETPGGGGWGKADPTQSSTGAKRKREHQTADFMEVSVPYRVAGGSLGKYTSDQHTA